MITNGNITIGVLALQGAFHEHLVAYKSLGVDAVTVRTPQELADPKLSALVIPGGESTTMALVAERTNLMEPLRQWVKAGKPVWGTCAGLIFLANEALHTKKGGQQLLGGLDIVADRNHFGTQKDSFETWLPCDHLGKDRFHAIFIRAPVIVKIGDEVEVLAKLTRTDPGHLEKDTVVAVRQGPLLATAFHPELTKDYRWHQLFLDMVVKHYNQ